MDNYKMHKDLGGVDQPQGGGGVVFARFPRCDCKSLFYAKTFYEFPVASLLVHAQRGFHIIDANRRAVEGLETSAFEIIGMRFQDVFCSDDMLSSLMRLAEERRVDMSELLSSKHVVCSRANRSDFQVIGLGRVESQGGEYLILQLYPCNPTSSDFFAGLSAG